MSVKMQNKMGMLGLLMDAAGAAGAPGGSGGGGAAGTGGGSLLTPSGGGGGSAPAAGVTPPGNGAAAGGSAPAAGAGADNNTNGGAASDWRSGLPAELQKSASLGKFTDVSALAGAYVAAEKLIGAKGIPKPGPHSTDQDWANIFKELGQPESLDKYEVKFQDGLSIQKDFVDEFKKSAFEAGILPKQAQKIADWFTAKNQSAEESVKTMIKTNSDKAIDGLKQEWGQGFDKNLSRAQAVLKSFGDPALAEFLDKTGLGNDVRLVKLLANVGNKYMSEDKVVGGESTIGGALTPAQAKQKISIIQADTKHPYHIKDHPGHQAAVDEVKGFYEMAHPST